MTNHPRFARAVAAGLALLALTGCSMSVTTGSPSNPPATTAPAPATTAVPGTPEADEGTPAGAVPVDTLVATSTRPAQRTTATVKGDATGARHDSALSLWAGCEGAVDEITFGVAGHQIFQGKLGLRASVPDDIVIEVLILVDGDAVQNIQLDGTNPTPALVPVRFLIKDAKTVTTRTKVVRGNCTESTDSYAVLVDGYVH